MPHHGTHAACGKILFHMAPFTLRVFALAASLAFAAPAQLKPTLKPADYGRWETLGPAALSPDGKWLAHEIRRTDKNDELRVGPAGGGKTHVLAFCSNPAFSADSRWLACEATVSEAEQDKLKKAKKPVQNKMAVLELATGAVTTVDDVQSLAFSGDAAFLAFRRYPPTREPGGGRGNAEPGDPAGSTLTVRNLATGVDTTFGNVTGFAWQDKGTNLAMTVGVEGRTGNAIQVFDPKAGSLRVLDSGPAVFTVAGVAQGIERPRRIALRQAGRLRRRKLRRPRVEESGRDALRPSGGAEAHRRVARRPNGRRTARRCTWASRSGSRSRPERSPTTTRRPWRSGTGRTRT